MSKDYDVKALSNRSTLIIKPATDDKPESLVIFRPGFKEPFYARKDDDARYSGHGVRVVKRTTQAGNTAYGVQFAYGGAWVDYYLDEDQGDRAYSTRNALLIEGDEVTVFMPGFQYGLKAKARSGSKASHQGQGIQVFPRTTQGGKQAYGVLLEAGGDFTDFIV